jgi:hypothetical protein
MNDDESERGRWRYLLALAAGVVSAAIIMGSWKRYANGTTAQLGAVLVCAMPVLLGLLAGTFRPARPARTGLVMGGLALAGGIPILGEGAVCLVAVFPIYVLAVVIVAAITGAIVRHRRGKRAPGALTIGLLLLPAAASWVDARLPSRPLPTVTIADSVVIDAPRDAVWATVAHLELGFPDHATNPTDELLAAMLPRPRALVGDGVAPGSVRRVVFDNGTLLATVTRSEPPRRFDIDLRVVQAGREFFDHWAELIDASFSFDALPDGRTRMTHASRYRPRVAPRWYFEPLERFFASKVQASLLQEFVRQRFVAPQTDGPGPAVAAR